jgi:hypothetical protein
MIMAARRPWVRTGQRGTGRDLLINAGAGQAQSSGRYQVSYASDPDEAEAMVGRVFLPNRLEPRQPTARLFNQVARRTAGQRDRPPGVPWQARIPHSS